MNCDRCQALIDDYVDDALPAEDRAAVEQHLAACAVCRTLAEDFRAIRLAAADLERHAPPARTWARISSAVQDERERRRGWLRVGWQPLAIAATLLLIVGGTSWVVWRQLGTADTSHSASAPSPTADPELVQSVELELKLAEEHYQKAIVGLEQITKAESGQLDPQIASVLQKNLDVIDQAITESRAALQTQPTSEVAQESLFEALRSKVSLLQSTVGLINEMRQGNQEGAARIVSGLKQ
jgi:hypothetical protein